MGICGSTKKSDSSSKKEKDSSAKYFNINKSFAQAQQNAKKEMRAELKRGQTFKGLSSEAINDRYEIEKEIGRGTYGVVHLAKAKGKGRIRRAIKIISKDKFADEDLATLKGEINAIKELDHPNIIKFHEVFECPKTVSIVMESCTGGDLLDYKTDRGSLKEEEIKSVAHKILSALNHCHMKGIVHRDLKPENIIFESKSLTAELKIIDFGMAVKYVDKSIDNLAGSPFYIAPEVLEKNSDFKCDLWSLGVILFCLITDQPPFLETDTDALFKAIKTQPIKYDSELWKDYSPEAQDLVKSLLTRDKSKRPSAEEALKCSWFSDFNKLRHRYSELDNEILIDFKLLNKADEDIVLKLVLDLMIGYLTKQENDKLEKFFKILDRNDNGEITLEEIMEAFSKKRISLTQEDTNHLHQHMNKVSCFKYKDFQEVFTLHKLSVNKTFREEAFDYLDVDKDQILSRDDIRKSLQRTLIFDDSEELEKFLATLKEEHTFEDFEAMFI